MRSFGQRWFYLLPEGGDGRRDGVDGGMGLYLLFEIQLVAKYEYLTQLGVIQNVVADFFNEKKTSFGNSSIFIFKRDMPHTCQTFLIKNH